MAKFAAALAFGLASLLLAGGVLADPDPPAPAPATEPAEAPTAPPAEAGDWPPRVGPGESIPPMEGEEWFNYRSLGRIALTPDAAKLLKAMKAAARDLRAATQEAEAAAEDARKAGGDLGRVEAAAKAVEAALRKAQKAAKAAQEAAARSREDRDAMAADLLAARQAAAEAQGALDAIGKLLASGAIGGTWDFYARLPLWAEGGARVMSPGPTPGEITANLGVELLAQHQRFDVDLGVRLSAHGGLWFFDGVAPAEFGGAVELISRIRFLGVRGGLRATYYDAEAKGDLGTFVVDVGGGLGVHFGGFRAEIGMWWPVWLDSNRPDSLTGPAVLLGLGWAFDLLEDEAE